jgi:hypothetical protein
MFTVNFNTGAGNYKSDKDINDLKLQVNDELAYTQESVTIEDEDGNIMARLPWYGCAPTDEDIVTAQFGSFGFYGEWILGE